MSTRIMMFLAILGLIVVPSAVRTFGFYSGEMWRFQQSLGGDKVLHLIVGASLMAAFVVFSKTFFSIQRLSLIFLFASSILVVEELFQLLIPGRHFEWVDMFFGLVGVTMVFTITLSAVLFNAKKRKKN